jgi:hypothetical protein
MATHAEVCPKHPRVITLIAGSLLIGRGDDEPSADTGPTASGRTTNTEDACGGDVATSDPYLATVIACWAASRPL